MEFDAPRKKPFKLGKVTTVDMETGEVVEERSNAFTMMPCAADKCQECAVDHAHDQPHNNQSMYYRMQFHAKHGRWPTWADAVAHCPEPVRAAWERELRRRGAWSEPDAPASR